MASLININTANDHVTAMMHAEQRQVDAIILFGSAFRDDMLRDKRFSKSFPDLYVLARDSQTEIVTAINTDTGRAMQEICAHLASGNYNSLFHVWAKNTFYGTRAVSVFYGVWSGKLGQGMPEITSERYSATSGAKAMREYLSL